ncbi:hypothetical protein X805_02230 [Sphaerotilus natans subsp. natans DSM 6575]|uniref:Uncharacterized protein n=1 Tax=Sphaerotilus natans subsp. natans DSM 6575 TaxID=1286631 RepID=A0A059KS29_9BURK|nr:hypothetical protein X805_02230 [Sphaerotilus natans subsp. natans DSM 6575]
MHLLGSGGDQDRSTDHRVRFPMNSLWEPVCDISIGEAPRPL